MILLRNVLLSVNGLLLMLSLTIVRSSNLGWVLPTILIAYLILDFVYLSLTYPRRTISEYVALLTGSTQEQDATLRDNQL